jgi:tight adherence protein B
VIVVAAMGRVDEARLLYIGASLVALLGLWLLASSSARRSLLAERGGAELETGPSVSERLDARLVRTRRGAVLGARLNSVGSSLGLTRFLAFVAAAAIGAALLVSIVFPPLLAVAAGLVAGWACVARLERQLEKRKEQFVAQLPEVARLLANGASAGLSMPAAIELAVREIQPPASEELQTVIDELTFGRSLDDSLASLQRRLPSREIAVLLTTLIIQQRAGGDVVRALSELSHTLDQRRDTLREVKTLMAGAVFSSYLVPILGLGALLMLDSLNSHTLDQMTSTPIGIAALIVASLLYAAGTVAIRRVTRIEL